MTDTTETRTARTYDVGGVRLARPFQIRRFAHFGFNLVNFERAVDFYTEDLGFRVTDDANLFEMLDGKALAYAQRIVTNPRMVFTSNSADHHALLLTHKTFGTFSGNDAIATDNTVSQITWQVATLDEVVDAADYFRERDVRTVRVGRDMPGSNWHVYFLDPDGNTVELCYGMEQIGWDRASKPHLMHYRGFERAPARPQMSEAAELREATSRGIDIDSGSRSAEQLHDETFDVGGILLPRPFKVTGMGPFSLFTDNLDVMVAFYTSVMGFHLTEEATYAGKRIVYLRHGLEHHSLVLAEKALRAALGLREDASCLSVGMQVGSYRQLRDAVGFLTQRGHRLITLPAELHLGVDYAAHVQDPDGHLIQLYFSMDHVGWDGRPRPAHPGTPCEQPWPEAIDAQWDTLAGTAFMGPLG